MNLHPINHPFTVFDESNKNASNFFRPNKKFPIHIFPSKSPVTLRSLHNYNNIFNRMMTTMMQRRGIMRMGTMTRAFATVTGSTAASSSTSTSSSASKPEKKLRIVVAVGGNALQRRGDRLTIENMLKAAAEMAPMMAELCSKHEVVMTHGNGPQVGELALERSAASFDVLGAESMGQIGYVLAQAMQSAGLTAVPILTQVVVDQFSEAFKDPTKFVGPIYGSIEAQALQQSLGWTIKPDGEYFRRVVPSPPPLEILQIDAIKTLLKSDKLVLPIACGGGGIPVARIPACPTTLQGVEAVIDKDVCGSKLSVELEADGYIILTDGGGIWENFGKPEAREMEAATPEYLKGTKAGQKFPGSMGPKVMAAIDFVENSKKPGVWAAIGDLKDAAAIVEGKEGTYIKNDVEGGVMWRKGRAGPVQKESKDPPPF
jgi:carbamate kinase